jgi:transcriptional regulator with XRE-family HTH domain
MFCLYVRDVALSSLSAISSVTSSQKVRLWGTIEEMLGERLRRSREAKELRNRQVCDHLEMSPAHLSDMESGKSNPSVELLARLADLYGVSADYLLGFTEDPRPYDRGEPLPYLAEKITAALRKLSPVNAERLLAMAKGLVEHQDERTQLARERARTLQVGAERFGSLEAAAIERLVVEAVAAGVPDAVILAAFGLLGAEDAPQE